jgi:hypothetical protein
MTDKYISTINPLYKIKNNDIGINRIAVEQVELQTKKTEQASHRNSPSYVLGEHMIIDDALKWRVKWGQVGIAVFSLLGMTFFVAADATSNDIVKGIGLTFGSIALLFFLMIFHKNVSFTIMKRLLKEPNVIIIIAYGICEVVINIVKPYNALSPINGGIFFLVVLAVVFIDSVKVKSRVMVIIFFSIFTFLNIYNIYDNTIGTNAVGVKLISYTIQGQDMVIWKRSIKRNIYLQILLFSMSAIRTMLKDKKMELMIFATSNVYRATGTGGNTSTNNTIENIALAETNFGVKDRNKTMYMLGEHMIIDDALKWRVKWGQVGVAVFSLLGMTFFVAADATSNDIVKGIGLTFGSIALLFFLMIFHKNVSFTIMKRLLKEPNVIIIIAYGICEVVVNIVKPYNALSPINGGIFFLVVLAVVFIDSVKVKSRVMVIIFFSIFTFLNIYNIYDNTIGTNAVGVKLISYTIQGQDMVIWKRSIKRNSYLQILLFSMSAIRTMLKDKKMELMIFATSNVYRATGTTSKSIVDEQFSFKRKHEHGAIL